jgi:hypothetical protein
MAFPLRQERPPRRSLTALVVLLGLALALAPSCAAPDLPSKRFSEILQYYPPSDAPLQVRTLSAKSAAALPASARTRAVTVIVHPAYSLFFRDERRSRFTEAKYDLLKYQLDGEARFISEIARSGNILVLLLPGNFEKESIAPLSYTTYLNAAAGNSPTVFAIYSEIWSSGVLATDTMVTLYRFLSSVKAERVLVGGGYIGRCQREFYNQLTAYVDAGTAYVVPEVSSISPDDISDQEAVELLSGIRRNDFSLVRKFIDKRTEGAARTLPLAPLHQL